MRTAFKSNTIIRIYLLRVKQSMEENSTNDLCSPPHTVVIDYTKTTYAAPLRQIMVE